MENQNITLIMNKNISALRATTTVQQALETMQQKLISSVVVVDEITKPIGIFTEYDAIKLVAKKLTSKTLHSLSI